MDLLTLAEVRKVVEDTCTHCGYATVASAITLAWSNRMTAAMGNAAYKRDGSFTVKLSTPLFLRATVEERRQTVIHEVCHVLDKVVNKVRMSHGRSWKGMMRRAGVAPKRCHNVDNTGLRKARKSYRYACPHGHREYVLGPIRHRNMQQPYRRKYVCHVCKTILTHVA
jgi:predicted SprT family Zn-dependent metalloprotease